MSEAPVRTLPPFLDSNHNAHDIYRFLPYHKDIELCPPEMIRLLSGNVVKYYTIVREESVTIDTNNLAEHLVKLGKQASARYHSHIIVHPEDIIDGEASVTDSSDMDEAVAALLAEQARNTQSLTDSDSSMEDLPDANAAPKEAPSAPLTNPFADIEDDDDFSFLSR